MAIFIIKSPSCQIVSLFNQIIVISPIIVISLHKTAALISLFLFLLSFYMKSFV